MKKLLLSVLVVVIIGVLAGYGLSWLVREQDHRKQSVAPVVEEQLPPRLVQLYFSTADGLSLVMESQEIPGCDSEDACIEGVVNALIAGSQQGAVAVLPKETRVANVSVENDLVKIDFSRHLSDFHPGGDLSELLTIYSLIDTLNENYPYIRQLQIYINGEVRQTLKGHARIDQPVTVDFSLTQGPISGDDSGSEDELSVEDLIEKATNQDAR